MDLRNTANGSVCYGMRQDSFSAEYTISTVDKYNNSVSSTVGISHTYNNNQQNNNLTASEVAEAVVVGVGLGVAALVVGAAIIYGGSALAGAATAMGSAFTTVGNMVASH